MKNRKGGYSGGFEISFVIMSLVLIAVLSGQWAAEEYSILGNVECESSEIEMPKKFFASYCLDYREHKDVVIQKLKDFDKPVTDGQISDVITYLEEDEVKAVLYRYQEEEGQIYKTWDNGLVDWEYLESGSR